MPQDQLEDMIRRYRQELLQFQTRSSPSIRPDPVPPVPPPSKIPSANPPAPINPPVSPVPQPAPMTPPASTPPSMQAAPPAAPTMPNTSTSTPPPAPAAPGPSVQPVPPAAPSRPISPAPTPPKPPAPSTGPTPPPADAVPVPSPPANIPPEGSVTQLPLLDELMRCDNDYTDSGRLRVAATTARQAVPVQGADVTIYCTQNGERRLKYFLTTDESGLTPMVPLPAPPAINSGSPGIRNPYAVYGIRISKPGFVPVQREDLQVFAGISGTVSFDLIPGNGAPPADERG